MEIIKKKLSELKPAPYNPRRMEKREMDKLKNSIKMFGYVDLIIQNKRTGYIVGGNQRHAALSELYGPEYEVDVVIVDLSDSEEKALNIALNKIGGEFDEDKLKAIFESIKGGIEIGFTGFDDEEISKILDKNITLQEDDFDVDAATEKPKYDVKPGDIYKLGDHRLICGDSLDKEQVGKLMNNYRADCVFTDPPYNVDYGANKHHPSWKIRAIANDKQTPEDWKIFNQRLIETIKTYYKGGDIYVWGASGADGMRQRLQFIDAGFHWSATIIWKKQSLVLSPANYQRLYEPCFYGWLTKSSFQGDRKQTELWEIDRPISSKLHPTMKPIELCSRAIRNSTIRGDIVLDLFGGSGSSLIAAESVERTCYIAEIDPAYCSVIIERWELFTGKKAEKVLSAEPKNNVETNLT